MSSVDFSFQPGTCVHGFRVVAVTPVASLRGMAFQFEHVASGARVLHLVCDDAENAFTVSFPTPPPDDTGMPHILEHMVLAGSEKFPVKEPFFEMVKMSMATFINAMTGYDTTYYPVCSNVERDLFNLAEVYFDAVFHPLLTASTFAREAHHLAPVVPNEPDGAWRIDGIVYSEMKGVFSDPESILARDAIRLLLPDTCYGRESGGTPQAIPDLTHEALRAFHASHYHPSNAYIVLYGNIPTERYLAFLAPRLAPFARRAATRLPGRQPRWQAPRFEQADYPVGAAESTVEKTYLLMNWLTGDTRDTVDAATLRLLSLLLLGHDAAPLHRALIDSRLGADLVHSGAGEAGCEMTFHVGLEGAEADRFPAFQNLVLDTLRGLADTPFTDEQIQTAFQQAAYETLEIAPLFPLHTVFRVVGAWMAGLDPLTYLDLASHYQHVRERLRDEPTLFNRLIRERLLDNPHRLDILLAPSTTCEARREAELADALDRRRSALGADERRALAAAAAELDRANGTPNPPEAVALLPQLSPSDIPPDPLTIPTTIETLDGGTALLVNDLLTNGIVYLALQFDLTGLPERLWPYLPRYADAINKFGAANDDYAALAARVGANTGGIAAAAAFRTTVDDPGRLIPVLQLSMKTLAERIDPALDLLGDILFALNPRDSERMRDVLTQVRAENRVEMIQNGSATVRLQAGRQLNAVNYLEHLAGGLPQLALSEAWVADFARGSRDVTEAIEAIQAFVLNRRRVSASVTAPAAATDAIRTRLAAWLARMDNAPLAAAPLAFTPSSQPRIEGLAASLQIAHCAMVLPAPHLSHPDEPLLAIGAHLLAMDYLLPEIRFKGNAYGAGFSHQPLAGTFSLTSFRDPRLAETIDVFRRAVDFVRTAPWSQADIDRGIIGVAKRDGKPLRPAEATSLALHRHTVGETFARRRARRQRLLQATPASVRHALVGALEAGLPQASVCVLTERGRLEQARSRLAGLVIEDVLK